MARCGERVQLQEPIRIWGPGAGKAVPFCSALQGLGFRIQALGFRAWGLMFKSRIDLMSDDADSVLHRDAHYSDGFL